MIALRDLADMDLKARQGPAPAAGLRGCARRPCMKACNSSLLTKPRDVVFGLYAEHMAACCCMGLLRPGKHEGLVSTCCL